MLLKNSILFEVFFINLQISGRTGIPEPEITGTRNFG
jgi:hypothetical protein